MKYFSSFIASAVLILASVEITLSQERPRILITTDIGGDPDDQQSLVRLMVSNEGIARIQMPDLKRGEYIPVVLRVRDNGSPQLVFYKRVVLVNR